MLFSFISFYKIVVISMKIVTTIQWLCIHIIHIHLIICGIQWNGMDPMEYHQISIHYRHMGMFVNLHIFFHFGASEYVVWLMFSFFINICKFLFSTLLLFVTFKCYQFNSNQEKLFKYAFIIRNLIIYYACLSTDFKYYFIDFINTANAVNSNVSSNIVFNYLNVAGK